MKITLQGFKSVRKVFAVILMFIVTVGCFTSFSSKVSAASYIFGESTLSGEGLIGLSASGPDITPDERNLSDYYLNYDESKSATDKYEINYQTTLNMSEVWSKFRSLKALASMAGQDIKRTIVNSCFEVTITFDSRLTVDASMLTESYIKAEFDEKNPEMASYLTVASTSYDLETGVYKVDFNLDVPGRVLDGWDVDGTMDGNLGTLKLDVPTGAVSLPASEFTTLVGSNSLDLVDGRLEGYMIINGNPDEALYIQNIARINVPYSTEALHVNLTMQNSDSKPAMLNVTKEIKGDEGFDTNKEFSFIVTKNENSYIGNYIVGENVYYTSDGSFTLKAGETATFEFEEGDQFNISEADYSSSGYTTTYTGDTTGQMKLHQSPVIVTNTYTSPDPIEVNLDESSLSAVVKNLSGELPKNFTETFYALLTPEGDAPIPTSNNASATMTSTGTIIFSGFGTITFTKAGTYVYTVQETLGSTDGMTYDNDGDQLIITVTESDNTLNAQITKGAVIENNYEVNELLTNDNTNTNKSDTNKSDTNKSDTNKSDTTKATSNKASNVKTGDSSTWIFGVSGLVVAFGMCLLIIFLKKYIYRHYNK
ncbi:MAG: Spy0128 family protein [Paludibacteraceae bacterium]